MDKVEKAFREWWKPRLHFNQDCVLVADTAFAAGAAYQRAQDLAHVEAACPLHDSTALAEFVVEMRGIRGEVCKKCGGWGIYNYPSTATWRGGIGGQMFTNDVCDKCWGSGDATHPWPNRRGKGNEWLKLKESPARITAEEPGEG